MSAFYPDKADDPNTFDVVICGAGLAGLTLVRQLRLENPQLKVAIFDRATRPFPDACLKVGESSVEVGTNYYGSRLKLNSYFAKKHVPKLGLRFFFGDTRGPVEDRPEVGAINFPEVPSFQIDRGILENDLREMAIEEGAYLFEGYTTKDIVLSTDGGPHQVIVQGQDKEEHVVHCRWVVDATGRRRMLQNKLGLKTPNGHDASAAWFRLEGRIDVDDLVPASNTHWHGRMPTRTRFYSTNHLMGKGYWVWLIPLGSGNTSLGIVTGQDIHPVSTYNSYEKAMDWLREHEPVLAKHIEGMKPLDFLCYKNYSYGSHQILSDDRWTCVGEAGLFVDPFYSPGSDFICMGNTMTQAMIVADLEGTLTREYVEDLNALVLMINEGFVDLYRNSYGIWGTAHVMTAKILWDWSIYWAFFAQLCFQDIIARQDTVKELFNVGKAYLDLNAKGQQLFRDWGKNIESRAPFEFLNPFEVPYVLQTHVELATERNREETLQYLYDNLPMFEHWLDSLAAQAAAELPSEVLEQFRSAKWYGHVPSQKADTQVDEEGRKMRERMDLEMIPVFGQPELV